ncbi:MAG: hypothetical protein JXQ81_01295 [Desulfuromonadales bacterium]|nr:hypothetical protein [Desulfuromonadales bacterium]MBN2791121.1 hypothetical protein [Desulfuromonadales bacterium]
MKKLFLLFVLMAVTVCCQSAACREIPLQHQSVQDPKPLDLRDVHNPEEREIVALLKAYENACNRYHAEGVYLLYSADALMGEWGGAAASGVDGGQSLRLAVLEEKLAQWDLYQFTLRLQPLKSFTLEDDQATVELPYLFYSVTQDYWEKGTFRLVCKKEEGAWKISLSERRIEDLHYTP